jgi:hypothetical protein
MKRSNIVYPAPASENLPRLQRESRGSAYLRHPDVGSGNAASLRLLRRAPGLADSLSRLRGGSPVPGGRTHLQRTLWAPVRCTGIGVHSGRPVTMTIRPGRANAGVVFVRVDVPPGARIIRAHWTQVESTQLSTVVGNGEGLSASAVEHLMAGRVNVQTRCALRLASRNRGRRPLPQDFRSHKTFGAMPFPRLSEILGPSHVFLARSNRPQS